MYEGMSFDELNSLYEAEHEGKRRSMPYKEYFGGMDISKKQKEEREESAEKLEEIFRDLLALVFYLYAAGSVEFSLAAVEAEQAYRAYVTGSRAKVSEYFTSVHIPDTVYGVVDTMMKDPENMFNYTNDRAMLIAENEANSMWNDADFEDALASGKTTKTWHTVLDKRTRDSHRGMDGATKPILEPFAVSESLMQFPRDESLGAGPEEIANCRCSVTFS